MKKFFSMVLFMVAVASMLTLSGCSSEQEVLQEEPQFGFFTYRGNKLTSFSKETLDYQNALSMFTNEKNRSVSAEEVNSLLSKYKSVTIVSKFWTAGKDGTDLAASYVATNEVQGTDFKNILTNNEVTITTGIVAKYLFLNRAHIQDFESQNVTFQNSPESYISPFPNKFSFHSNLVNFVLQSHTFAEIPSSTNGGAGCTFIQQNEGLYNSNGTIARFQSSLGIKLQTPRGTTYEGTIFEISFTWNLKNE